MFNKITDAITIHSEGAIDAAATDRLLIATNKIATGYGGDLLRDLTNQAQAIPCVKLLRWMKDEAITRKNHSGREGQGKNYFWSAAYM